MGMALVSCNKEDKCFIIQTCAGDYVKTHCFRNEKQLNRWKSECDIREDGLCSLYDDCWGL